MVRKGQITPLTPEESVPSEDEKLEERVDHPTSICHHLREIIQDSFDKRLLKFKDTSKTTVNVMALYDHLCNQLYDASDEEDVLSLVADVAITKVHKLELADDGLVDHVSPSLSTDKLPILPQRRGEQVCLLCSFVGRITTHDTNNATLVKKQGLL